jgi:hypothetical protein
LKKNQGKPVRHSRLDVGSCVPIYETTYDKWSGKHTITDSKLGNIWRISKHRFGWNLVRDSRWGDSGVLRQGTATTYVEAFTRLWASNKSKQIVGTTIPTRVLPTVRENIQELKDRQGRYYPDQMSLADMVYEGIVDQMRGDAVYQQIKNKMNKVGSMFKGFEKLIDGESMKPGEIVLVGGTSTGYSRMFRNPSVPIVDIEAAPKYEPNIWPFMADDEVTSRERMVKMVQLKGRSRPTNEPFVLRLDPEAMTLKDKEEDDG